VTAWLGGFRRSPRQVVLAGCAAVLLAVAVVSPLSRDDVTDSVAVSLAFFATLLTGEAVVFALSFSPSSSWPSLREIDAHIAFREWVVTGWVASMLFAGGLLTDTAVPGSYAALLFLLADAFGMFSFIRLFGLASADGRKRLLSRTLAGALSRVSVPAPELRRRMSEDRLLGAYLGQIDDASARSDGGGARMRCRTRTITPSGGVAAVSFQVGLALEGVIDRLDDLAQRPEELAACPRGLALAAGRSSVILALAMASSNAVP
jgi:hypothetical protein